MAALNSEVEARVLIFDEVERDLREALLLQISDDALAQQVA